MKYIKRPIPISAIQWTGTNFDEISNFMGENHPIVNAQNELVISTLEGDMRAPIGAYIICGVTGTDFYPCAKDVFEKSYIEIKEDKYFNLNCDKCGEGFLITNPEIIYDGINNHYKYWTLCPNCKHQIEWEIE